MTDQVQKIREEVEKLRIKNTEAFDCGCDGTKCAGYDMACDDILSFIDSMQEEPVSEDLEEAADNALNNVLNAHEIVNIRSCLEMFKYGAQWKEKEMQSTIELAEDHAMLAGMEKMKERMMAKAVETTFNVSLPSGLYDKLWINGCQDGDKLLVIKENEL